MATRHLQKHFWLILCLPPCSPSAVSWSIPLRTLTTAPACARLNLLATPGSLMSSRSIPSSTSLGRWRRSRCPSRWASRKGKPCNCRLTRHTATSYRLRWSSRLIFCHKTTYHIISYVLEQFGTGKPCVICQDKTRLVEFPLRVGTGARCVRAEGSRSLAWPLGQRRTHPVEETVFLF